MKSLLKVIIIICLCSASTFFLVQMTGLISIDKIEIWFNEAQNISPLYLGGVVILLMFVDLFISIPTLATIMLAGHFMGYQYGALVAISGLMIAGNTGYLLGKIFGDKILNLILKDKTEREELKQSFEEHGFFMILFSRAVPILPEVTTCIAGMSGMSYPKFLMAWTLSITPYTMLAAYAGHISSITSPGPAILAWAVLSSILWTGWYFFRKKQLKG